MLKTTGFAKSNLSRVHNNPFNPLTLSAGAAQELNQKSARKSVDEPSYTGTGAVFEKDKENTFSL